jgi:amino acid transporter
MKEPTPKSLSGLRSKCLSFPETLSQSVANLSPTCTPVLVLPAVFAAAGPSTVMSYLFATIGLLLVGLNVNQFAKRTSSPGSLYSFISRGAGVEVGMFAGWCMMAAYLFCGMGVLSGAVNYAIILLNLAHFNPPPVAVYAVLTLGCWFVAYKDIRLSTRMMLVLEVLSMILILIVGVAILTKGKTFFDPSQLDLTKIKFSSLQAGLVLAIFSFVGYESSSTLGDEAKNPLVNIPRAIILTCVIAGVFFMFTSYIGVLGFEDVASTEKNLTGVTLDASSAPYGDLATHFGLPFLGVLISISAVISLWACTLASINSGARTIFSLGRHGIIHPHLGKAHDVNETPHNAVTLGSIIIFAIPAIMLGCHFAVLDIFNDLSTVSTYGFIFGYGLVSVAAPFYLKKIGQLTAGSIVLSVISVLFMIPPLIATVYPVPTPVTFANLLPYLFIVYLVMGIFWIRILKNESSNKIILEIKHDLEMVHNSLAEHPVR